MSSRVASRLAPRRDRLVGRVRRLLGSIGVRLFLLTFGSMALVFVSFSYFSMRRTSEAWTRSFEQHAQQTSAVIEGALRYGMLLNRKEEVHATLRNIAREPGIDGIRIYDKTGRIKFSTDETELGRRVDRHAEACVLCHDENDRPRLSPGKPRSRTFLEPNGGLVMGLIRPIQNSPQCSSGVCHAHSSEQSILGVLDLKMSMDAIREGHRQAERATLQAALLMAMVGGVAAAWFIWRVVREPVRRLVEGTRGVASGDLGTRIVLRSGGEFQAIAEAFNRMTEDLSRARERTRRWEDELAHAVREKTEELSRAQQQMLHMEKMASLGKLSAVVAHELNNPLAGILVYAKLIQRELATGQLSAEQKQETVRYLEVIRQESARCGDIVRNLLLFARQSKVDFRQQNFNAIVERSLMTVQHLARQSGIEVVLELLPGDDLVTVDANQLQQALVALLVNAIEAMPSGGKLTIRAEEEGSRVRLQVSDTGVGIAPAVLPHIFEPFVSTKGEEKGVGLGLSVAYGIIRRHEGQIEVDSEVGVGSTFRVIVPRRLTPLESGNE